MVSGWVICSCPGRSGAEEGGAGRSRGALQCMSSPHAVGISYQCPPAPCAQTRCVPAGAAAWVHLCVRRVDIGIMIAMIAIYRIMFWLALTAKEKMR